MAIVCATLTTHLYFISGSIVEFFFPPTSYACPASIYYKSFKIIELWNQNQILQKHQILKATHTIKLYFQQCRFFYFSLKLHIFTTKKIQIKVPRQMFKNVTKFKLLGGSMVTTPSCHLALVWSI